MNNAIPQPAIRMPSKWQIALLLTLVIESVFFITVLVAYIALRAQISWDVAHTLPRLSIPLTNTGVLFLSAVIVAWALGAIRQDRRKSLVWGLLAAIALGLVFVGGQVYEFSHAGFRIADSSIGGVFFTLISFHAAHVLAGIFFLVLVWVRSLLGDFSRERFETVKLAAWFWFFVTAVWAVLFAALYLI